ncbi:MAG: toll/interleukin-1 receptor domain-containing protein [Methylocystis sp.]
MAKRIFINYRRGDTIATAGRLRDRLAREFGRNNVFMDIDTIPVGVDFVKHLETWLTDCKIVIALIGSQWVSGKDETGRRRIENVDDYVRLELATALRNGIMIVPVLVDGAAMPEEGELPEELAPLVN